MTNESKSPTFSAEVRERAVRLVQEHAVYAGMVEARMPAG